ncbi:MAG TPA: hypothetical protein VGF12_12040 [Roseateles sp.]
MWRMGRALASRRSKHGRLERSDPQTCACQGGMAHPESPTQITSRLENEMRLIALGSPLALAIALSGCATSMQAEQGKDLSSAGIAYARATTAVLELAADAAIDATSYRRVSLVARKASNETEVAERIDKLKTLDEEQVEQVRRYAEIKRSVGAVEAYFTGLQQLSGATPGDAVETSVKALVDRVNGVSAALEDKPDVKALLTPERKSAIAGFAKFLVKQAHGAAVGRALERDANMIGRALVLQEIALQVALGDLDAVSNEQWARFHRQRVLDPYGQGGVGNDWVNDRRTYIKAQATGTAAAAVKTASQAARQMQDVWARILSGATSGAEFRLMLQDVNEALDAAAALKKAF